MTKKKADIGGKRLIRNYLLINKNSSIMPNREHYQLRKLEKSDLEMVLH